MDDKFIQYLNSLSYQDVKQIHNRFIREANPTAKAYWGKVMSAKRAGWNDTVAQRYAQDMEVIGRDRILSVLPDFTLRKLETPQSVQNSPLSRDVSNYGGIGKYAKGKPITPSSFTPGSGEIPSPDELPVEPVYADPRASVTPKGTNTGQTKNNGSNVPKKASEKAALDRSSDKFAPWIPKRSFIDDPDIKAALDKLKSSSIESLRTQAESWTKQEADRPSTDLARRESLNYFLQDAGEAIAPIRDVLTLIEQRREEKAAGRIADRAMTNAPATPGVRGENRILSNLITQSQVAYSNPSQMIQPYADQINLGYQQDLARAREMSGGQAGTAMGLGQAAAIRRNQANLGMAPMLSDIYRQGLETTGALVGQQMQDDTWRDQQNIDLYKTANQNNQNLQQVAGMGLASSRLRSIQARNNMWDSLLTSPVFDVDTYMNTTRQNLTNPPQV